MRHPTGSAFVADVCRCRLCNILVAVMSDGGTVLTALSRLGFVLWGIALLTHSTTFWMILGYSLKK
eukprot:3579376-Karenia_brevis.AAC.1